jgi:hypothetical protein
LLFKNPKITGNCASKYPRTFSICANDAKHESYVRARPRAGVRDIVFTEFVQASGFVNKHNWRAKGHRLPCGEDFAPASPEVLVDDSSHRCVEQSTR